ncbi:MAG: M20/M25/M40 family metallo-hydrolase [Candidatus Rokubacteria bacterium]|nr:M20/M25/M40 family metallo-hydrolase [Candidatus Rokubacteria bacterium]
MTASSRSDNDHARKESLRTTLRDLMALHGAPGFEQSPVQYFQKRVAALADQVEVDRYGNVTATRRGRHERPRLMLSAHLDEIGLIVKAVEPSGFLRFDRLGGAADALLMSRRVMVNGHFGIVGAKPGHLQSPEEQARPASAADMYIDVGVGSAEEVARMGIRVGDPVTLIGELGEFTGGDRVCGKAMDDRVGVAILLQVLEELRDTAPHGTLLVVGTVLEQVGHRGAAMAAYRLEPDYAVAVDGLSAGDTPDSSPTRDIAIRMGQGPVVILAASTRPFRGSIAHPAMKRYVLAAAESDGVPVQLATHLFRGSTEASTIHLSRGGIPTISVGVPRRYSYSPNETVDLNDVAQAVQLLIRFVRDMPAHVDLGFV